jgi:hypothetical protein
MSLASYHPAAVELSDLGVAGSISDRAADVVDWARW